MAAMSLYDEVADMMARSWTVGRHVDRDTIMAGLRRAFPTEAALRIKLEELKAAAAKLPEDAVGIAQADTGKPDQPSITCPKCGMTSYHPTDIAEGFCAKCDDWTTKR